MKSDARAGLGELLRYVGELVDRSADEHYHQLGLRYRARYTPVLRALAAGAETVSEIVSRSTLTQGAISQTVALMLDDDIIIHYPLPDSRKNGIRLTDRGRELLAVLEPHWENTFKAIDVLSKEVNYPVLSVLEAVAGALERTGFSQRIREAAISSASDGPDVD